jgi:hypothetical protein
MGLSIGERKRSLGLALGMNFTEWLLAHRLVPQ